MRVCDAALAVLIETSNPAVMWGERLRALSRQPGTLVSGHTRDGRGRRVRIFWLPGHEPERAKATG